MSDNAETAGAESSPTMEEETSAPSNSSYIVAVVVGGLIFLAYYFLVMKKKQNEEEAQKKKNRGKNIDVDETMATNSVGMKDITYIASKLKPDSTHLDILLAVASSPESIVWGTRAHLRKEKFMADRLEEDKKEQSENSKLDATKKTDSSGNMFELDDDGWADEDEDMDDEAKEKAKLAKKAEEEKKKTREELKKASGKTKIYLEGIDEGVIGQAWVEKTLGAAGAWPLPDLRFLEEETFEYDGEQVSAMDHPGLRRNLCHIAGRINSLSLNAHPELLEAASKQNIDQTYFRASAEFRQRCAILLEATLRLSIGFRNLTKKKRIVEAVCIFKIGFKSPDEVECFDGITKKPYVRVLPRLQIDNTTIANSKEQYEEMATGDVLLISLELTRLHAEAFTRQKIAMFQKQGIPPQVGLQSYREGWWYFLRGERMDGNVEASQLPIKTDGILSQVEAED
ncbi:MAG: hypothetical protein SGILL_009574, partial [Bacillariaceae sp.]